jgi:hypothetical protein
MRDCSLQGLAGPLQAGYMLNGDGDGNGNNIQR